MGLQQQRILRGIERELRRSDPLLTSVYRTFTRLHGREDMPGNEELKASPARRSARHLRAFFLPVALAVTACGVFIAGGVRGMYYLPEPAATRHRSP